MKLKLKNQTSTIFLAIITIFTFSSCNEKEFNKVMFGYVEAESVVKPSVDEIKNDLLNNKVDTWTFDKLEEFDSVEIVNSKILDDLNIEFEVSMKLTDYITHEPYKGNIILSYTRSNKDINYWIFNSVSGDIYVDNSIISNEENYSNQNNKTNFKDELSNIVKESAEEAISSTIVETLSGKSQSQTNSYPNCVWCGEEIKGTIYHVDYNGSQYDDDYYVSSTSGKGTFHYGCAYKICKKRR